MSLIRVLDVESTDFPPDADIVEIGFCDVYRGEVVEDSVGSMICKPTRAVGLEARAAHHLTDAELAEGVRPDIAVRSVLRDEPDVVCAHNAAFEKQFINASAPWICTLKVGRRLWPDCPSHANQVLRYYLGLDLHPAKAMPPHRAGPDAYVTAHILVRAMRLTSIEEMIAWSSEPSLLPRLNFGKHKGMSYAVVPIDYLLWLRRQPDTDPDVAFTVREELKRRAEGRN